MKNSTIFKIKESFSKILEEGFSEIPAHIRSDMVDALSEDAWRFNNEATEVFSGMYSQSVSDYEAHRKKFRDHIEEIQSKANQLLAHYKKGGFVKYEKDPASHRIMMKARTSVLEETTKFLNELNSMVRDFYENVYKMEENIQKPNQTSLF